jgi:holliday junction resolvase Hjr
MDTKRKGTVGERELVHAFWETGKWVAIRVAGSGSMRYPSPDIIAACKTRRVVIECKVTKEKTKYFTTKEINELRHFGELFNAESWVAIKFDQWYFLSLEDLERTEHSYVATESLARQKGLLFEELAQI